MSLIARLGKRLTQYRLSTLFLVMTVLAIWLAIKFYRVPMTAENLADVKTLSHIEKDVFEIEWSPDRTRLALVSWEKPVDLRETLTLFPIKTVGEGRKIIHFAFSPDPNVVAFCENGTTVEILGPQANTMVIETKSPQPSMKFSLDGKLLATGGYGNAANIWQASNGKLLQTLDMGGVIGGLTAVFSPDGAKVAVGNRNSTTRLFDVETGALLQEFDKPSSHGLAFHPSGDSLAIAYVDGSLAIWDVVTGKVIQEVPTGAEELYVVDWSPDGKLLASAGLNTEITIWNGATLVPLQKLESPEWVIGLRFSPDGTRIITAGGGRAPGSLRQVKVWGVAPF